MNIIISTLNELNQYKRSRAVLLQKYIAERLTDMVEAYNKETNDCIESLLASNSKKVLRELNNYG